MKNKLLILLAIAFIFTACNDFLPNETNPGNTTPTKQTADGLYRIRSAAGNYLSYADGNTVNCSQQNGYNTWYLKKAADGGYCFFKANENSDLLDLDNNLDNEGNIVKLHWYNGSSAQKWLIALNSDGSYQIRTSNSSGMVITDNGSGQITIQINNNLNTQKWFFEPVLYTYDFDDGFYRIRSAAGNYLSYNTSINVVNVSQQDHSNVWYLKKAAGGGYNIFKEHGKSDLLDLDNNSDTEGNKIKLWQNNGFSAQRWFIEPNGDGSYQIRTVNDSGRVVTNNGADPITLQTYNNSNTQKWNLSRMNDDEGQFAIYKQIMFNANKFNYDEVAIHNAEGQTNATLKAMLNENPDKENMIEGKYVVTHFSNQNWAKVDDPKDLVDLFDRVYELQLELMGRTEPIHDGRMVFLTEYASTLYAYTNGAWCVFSAGAADDFIKDWVKDKYVGWVIGHEIGHTMTGPGGGWLYEVYAIESWCNIFNVYALEKMGLKDYSREAAAGQSMYEGMQYDERSDEQRTTDILVNNTQIFVKFPLLLIDNYGWDGISTFMKKAISDHNSGIRTDSPQEKIDYMAVNLSIAYGMDLSDLLDYWRLNPTNEAKAQIANLPKEQTIAAGYGIQ